jgi:hypothetical protein
MSSRESTGEGPWSSKLIDGAGDDQKALSGFDPHEELDCG